MNVMRLPARAVPRNVSVTDAVYSVKIVGGCAPVVDAARTCEPLMCTRAMTGEP
jgi:hypothetical protein